MARSKRNRKKHRLRISIPFILVMMLLLAVITSASISAFEKLQGVFLKSPIFTLKGVSIQGNRRTRSTDILDASNLLVGTDGIYSMMSHIVEKRIKTRLRYLERVEIQRKINGWVTIIVKEREPVALIATSRDTDSFDVCDANGFILEQGVQSSCGSDLPVATYGNMPVIVKPITGDALRVTGLALEVLADARSVLPDLLGEISCIDARDPDNIMLILDREMTIRIASDRIEEGLSDIVPVIMKRREESKETKYIDARFPGAIYCNEGASPLPNLQMKHGESSF